MQTKLCLRSIAGVGALRFTVCLAAATAGALVVRAANEIRFVPDMVAQFDALTERPDPLGFYIGASPDPTACKHYQGMVRLQAEDGTPYLIVSRSGVLPDVPGPDDVLCNDILTEDDQPGNLLVVRMGSRDKFGERLRSNRLRRGVQQTSTAPEVDDTTVAFFTFDGADEWPNYGHPGGMQLIGDILVIALEAPYLPGLPQALFLFVDVSDPEHPHVANFFAPEEPGVKSGLVGITPLEDGRFLMMVTGGKEGATMWFYESTGPAATNLESASLEWTLVDTWEAAVGVDPGPGGTFVFRTSPDEEYLGMQWPEDAPPQTLQFLREGDSHGTLYLASARGKVGFGEDRLDLFRVDRDGSEVRLQLVSSRHKNSHPHLDPSIISPGNNTASFAAASTFYVSPSGELIFYATEHENDGPNDSVKAGEWRHIDMVRPGSPTHLPTLTLFTPYEVNEGDDTLLTGLARPPISRPWIELFTDPNFSSRYVVCDYVDWEKDNFSDFKDLDGSDVDLHFGFDNEPSSWRWFAPAGCTIRANDDHFGDGGFPGEFTRTLHGTGQAERDANLSSVPNDGITGSMNDEVTSVQFFANCDTYYNTSPILFWDTDNNGGFETIDSPIAPFDAAALDGPTSVVARVVAIHPIDGLAAEARPLVHVFNVAPSITALRVFDAHNLEVGVDVPFVLRHVPVTLRAMFTDPGKPDHQTATLAWGDGLSEANSQFSSFTDAFGGVIGQLTHTHAYSIAGDVTLHLTVTDDDAGATSQSTTVTVLTPEQALAEIIDMLDALIAAATNNTQRKALNKARDDLAGNGGGHAANGALDKLAKGNRQAALVKLRHAIEDLRAAAAGADVAAIIALLEQVIVSVENS